MKVAFSVDTIETLPLRDLHAPENLRAIHPGGGLQPKYLEVFTGQRVSRAVKRGTPVIRDLPAAGPEECQR